jgi:hypothetical protein
MRPQWIRVTAIVLAVLMAISGLGVGLTMFLK